jgi:hypothetical protein
LAVDCDAISTGIFDFSAPLRYTCWVDAIKPIRLSQHAKQQLWYRGATEGEVMEAIRTAEWKSAELNRLECRKEFSYEQEWNGRHYRTKQVRPIFVGERQEVVVVTVYVYYY